MARQQKARNESGEKGRYRAPALAKGLQILELLSRETAPITLSGMSEQLQRSRSEIFRMVQELEGHGYIRRTVSGDGYEITNKLFLLGMEQPRQTTLLEAALPHMRTFVRATVQSCHLAVPAEDRIVVVARIEAPGPVTFSVRVGHRQLISRASSGAILFAFQPNDVQDAWLEQFRSGDADFDEAAFLKTAEKTRKQGYFMQESSFIRGVTDIAAPVLRNGMAVASLTAPCLTRLDDKAIKTLPVEDVLYTVQAISDRLTPA